jgi:hypothetical protein
LPLRAARLHPWRGPAEKERRVWQESDAPHLLDSTAADHVAGSRLPALREAGHLAVTLAALPPPGLAS